MNEGPVSMGVAFRHDLLRVSLVSRLLYCLFSKIRDYIFFFYIKGNIFFLFLILFLYGEYRIILFFYDSNVY